MLNVPNEKPTTTKSEKSSRSEFWRGFKDAIPLWIGVVPFGIAYTIAAHMARLTAAQTLVMSLLVYAGASQFAATGLFAAGVNGLFIVVATLMINMRNALLTTSLAPKLRSLNILHRAELAFGVCDETYAISIQRIMDGKAGHALLLGANVSLYLCWQLSTITGLVIGEAIPDPTALGLGLVFPLSFTVLLVPYLHSRKAWFAAITGGSFAVAMRLLLPANWYLPAMTAEGATQSQTAGTGIDAWLTILGMALVTYATRALPLLTLRGKLPPSVERALYHVPPALFAALIVPGLLMPNGSIQAGATLWAGLFGAVIAWRTRKMELTIAAGFSMFALLRWIGIA